MRFDQNTADALQTVCPAVQPPLPLRLQLRHHPASVPTPTPPCPSARSSSLHPLCYHPLSCPTVPSTLTSSDVHCATPSVSQCHHPPAHPTSSPVSFRLSPSTSINIPCPRHTA